MFEVQQFRQFMQAMQIGFEKSTKCPLISELTPPALGLQNYPGKSSCRSLIAKRRTWNSLECLMDSFAAAAAAVPPIDM